MRILICLLFFSFLSAGEWNFQSKKIDGFSASISLNENAPKYEEEVALRVDPSLPSGWKLDWNLLERQILEESSLLGADFDFVQRDGDEIHLRPTTAGNFFINLGLIPFVSNDGDSFFLPGVIIPLSVEISAGIKSVEELTYDMEPLSLIPPFVVSDEIKERWMGSDQSQIEALLRRRTFPLFGGLFLLGFSFLAWIAWVFREELLFEVKQRYFPPQSPREKALSALNKLQKKAKGDGEKLFIGLGGIVKRHLDEISSESIIPMTTRECLVLLNRKEELSKKEKEGLSKLLKKIELVKFAKMKPSAEEYHQEVRMFIDVLEQQKTPLAKGK